MPSHKYKPHIDGLRAIAVIGVVMFHYFPKAMRGGFVGVDIFFVISGYLISSIIFSECSKNSFSFLYFYARRARRIFPALILVLLSSTVFGWIILFPPDFMALGKHITGGVTFVSNFLFWQDSGYFDAHAIEKPLLHLWSLGVEEQFYILWPFLAYMFVRFRWSLSALITTIIILSFVVNILLVHYEPIAGFFLPFGRFWQLLFGAYIAWCEFNKDHATNSCLIWALNKTIEYKNTISFSGVLLVTGSVFFLNDKIAYPGFWAVLPTLGAAFIIIAGQDAWFNRVVLSSRILVFIGLISYPLYLWHWPLISFTHYLYDERIPSALRILLIILSTALAWVTYKFLETPMRWQKPTSAAVLSACMLCIVIGVSGAVIYARDGFETRYEKRLRQLVNFSGTKASKFMIENKCFVASAKNVQTLQDCATSPSNPNLPSLMILGDSYAGHLYAGLNARFGSTWNVKQITSAGCAPILNLKSRFQPECTELNTKIFKLLKDNTPERVILSARWHLYNWSDVGSTIEYLRQIGVKQIDLVGPVPEWVQSLNRVLYKLVYKSSADTPIPMRLLSGLKPETALLDNQIRAFAQTYNVRYFAPRSILCNENGCLTYVNENTGALTTFDAGHLTKEGSVYLGRHFPE